MKKFRGLICILLIVSSLPALARVEVKLKVSRNGCDGRGGSADVVVSVGKEDKKFNPSCSFSFSERFETINGIECRVESGMCTSFSPKNKMVVQCDGASVVSIDFECPKK